MTYVIFDDHVSKNEHFVNFIQKLNILSRTMK